MNRFFFLFAILFPAFCVAQTSSVSAGSKPETAGIIEDMPYHAFAFGWLYQHLTTEGQNASMPKFGYSYLLKDDGEFHQMGAELAVNMPSFILSVVYGYGGLGDRTGYVTGGVLAKLGLAFLPDEVKGDIIALNYQLGPVVHFSFPPLHPDIGFYASFGIAGSLVSNKEFDSNRNLYGLQGEVGVSVSKYY